MYKKTKAITNACACSIRLVWRRRADDADVFFCALLVSDMRPQCCDSIASDGVEANKEDEEINA